MSDITRDDLFVDEDWVYYDGIRISEKARPASTADLVSALRAEGGEVWEWICLERTYMAPCAPPGDWEFERYRDRHPDCGRYFLFRLPDAGLPGTTDE